MCSMYLWLLQEDVGDTVENVLRVIGSDVQTASDWMIKHDLFEEFDLDH